MARTPLGQGSSIALVHRRRRTGGPQVRHRETQRRGTEGVRDVAAGDETHSRGARRRMSDGDYENDPELMAAVSTAAIPYLGKIITGARDELDPDYLVQRAAAVEICRRAGVLDLLRAVSADGVLRPP